MFLMALCWDSIFFPFPFFTLFPIKRKCVKLRYFIVCRLFTDWSQFFENRTPFFSFIGPSSRWKEKPNDWTYPVNRVALVLNDHLHTFHADLQHTGWRQLTGWPPVTHNLLEQTVRQSEKNLHISSSYVNKHRNKHKVRIYFLQIDV